MLTRIICAEKQYFKPFNFEQKKKQRKKNNKKPKTILVYSKLLPNKS